MFNCAGRKLRGTGSVVILLISIFPTAATGLAENPALCYGLIAAQSTKDATEMQTREKQIRALHGKVGPKDSTDERGFIDWVKIGREIAIENGADKEILVSECQVLLRVTKKN